MTSNRFRSAGWRWLKFNLVGAGGVVVQFGSLWVLTSVLHANYLIGTGCAVEAAVLHNVMWHERFTWGDRRSHSLAESLRRVLNFNLANGAISLMGNLLLMRLLVGQAHLPILAANAVSIAACSLVNFVASDLLVFNNPEPERTAADAPGRGSHSASPKPSVL